MFGIGMWELVVIVLILVIAVGPKRMPGFIKGVGKAYREFRKATRDLRASTGIDELLEDESIQDLKQIQRDLRRPTAIFDPSPPALTTPPLSAKDLGKGLGKDLGKDGSKRKPVELERAKKAGLDSLSDYELTMELPEQGVDFAELQYRHKLVEAAAMDPSPEPGPEPEPSPEALANTLPATRVEEPAEGERDG